MLLEVGTVLEGKVTGITGFGAFVALPGGKSGMVHISEVANTYVSDIHEHLAEGQTVTVKIIQINEQGKINLSIKKALPGYEETPRSAPRPSRPVNRSGGRSAPAHSAAEGQVAPRSADAVFEDKLKQFMQESDSKISGNRLYDHQRRSARRRK